MKKVFFIAMLSAAVAFAENTDSLKAEIERLNALLEQSQKNGETNIAEVEEESVVKKETPQFRTEVVKVTGEGNDTVFVESISAFRKVVDESREWSRNNILGIGGGPAVGIMYLDVKPVKKYLRELETVKMKDGSPSPLANSGISNEFNNREPALVTGGFGYGNFGNGTIVGGGGYGVLTEVSSKVEDTLYVANVNMGYGGFIIGGAWNNGQNAFSITSLIGAGGLHFDVSKEFYGNAFEHDNKWGSSDKYYEDDDIASDNMAFFALELQAAYTRSFMRWFHVGVETSGLFTYSRKGFNYSDNYVTISPTVRLKFVFGSL
ncbi:MAG: hypothetical protein FWF51_09855 [Chitinivibrionia bacterium]|nr:hypothetical protein [Chitinivibrionia bacterium]